MSARTPGLALPALALAAAGLLAGCSGEEHRALQQELNELMLDGCRAYLKAQGESSWVIGRTEAGSGVVRWSR